MEWSHFTKFEERTHDASPHLEWFDSSNQTPYIFLKPASS